MNNWVKHKSVAGSGRHTFTMENDTLIFTHQKVGCFFPVFPWVKSVREAFAGSESHNAWRTGNGSALVGNVVTGVKRDSSAATSDVGVMVTLGISDIK